MTNQANKILEMIEAVNDDTEVAVLGEIDARVWCWINRDKGLGFISKNEALVHGEITPFDWELDTQDQFTRSRDALKAIRPEGWCFRIKKETSHDALAQFWRDQDYAPTAMAKTEELAELHAIIQAVAWERENEQ